MAAAPDVAVGTFSPLRIFTNLDDHGRDLIKGLHKYYQEGLYTDYNLMLTNGKTIKCHRAVIAAKLPFFDGLFTTGTNMQEGTSDEINLDHIDPYCAELLVEYCYSGTMAVPYIKLKEMVNTAEFMLAKRIKRECDTFIMFKVNSSNVKEWYSFAKTFYLMKTYQYIETYFIEDILDTKEFLRQDWLDWELLRFDCQKDGSKVKVMLKAILKWVLHDVEERGDSLQSMVDEVQFCTEKHLRAVLKEFTKQEEATIEKYLNTDFPDESPHVTTHGKGIAFIAKQGSIFQETTTPFLSMWGCQLQDFHSEWSYGESLSRPWSNGYGDLLDCCGVTAIPTGFVITGGIFDVCREHEDFYPSPFCHFYKTVPKTDGPEWHDTYIPLPSMSEARYLHGCEYVNNMVYVFGGFTYDPRGMTVTSEPWGWKQEPIPTKTMQGLDVATMDWKPMADMPHSIASPVSAVVGKKMYVIGKQTSGGGFLFGGWSRTLFMRYDTQNNTWEDLAPPRYSFNTKLPYSAVYHEGEIFCMANDGTNYDHALFVSYDIEKSKWRTIMKTEEGVKRCSFFKHSETLYCVCLRIFRRVEMWEYDDDAREWMYSELEVPEGLATNDNIVKVVEVDYCQHDRHESD